MVIVDTCHTRGQRVSGVFFWLLWTLVIPEDSEWVVSSSGYCGHLSYQRTASEWCRLVVIVDTCHTRGQWVSGVVFCYCGHMSFQRTASLFSNVVFWSWWTHVTIGNYFLQSWCLTSGWCASVFVLSCGCENSWHKIVFDVKWLVRRVTIGGPRSGEPWTQKLKSLLVRTQSLNILPLKPGVGQ